MKSIRLRAEQLEDRLTPVTLPPGFTETLFASGIISPTAMAVAPDGRVFVAEQGGTVRIVQNGIAQPTPFVSLNVDSAGERGLIGIALDPNFPANGYVYVYHTVPGVPAHNRVSRFTASGDTAAPGSELVLIDLDPLSTATNHNGGALHFGTDGKLFIAVGDNANRPNSQSLTTRLGKILRINADGSIPADNPATIDGLGAVPAGVTRAIWAAGLRNPFTFAIGPAGEMFINDVGQNTFEEVNVGAAGANYGWPATEGTFDPAAFPNFTNPVFAYAHNGPHPFNGTAIIGGVVYNSSAFPAPYNGDYFFADASGGWINSRDPVSGNVTNFADQPTGQYIVGMDQGPDGQLLYLTRGPNGGGIYQIAYSAQPVAIAVGMGPGGTQAKLVGLPAGTGILSTTPFGNFAGGIRVASADVTGDAVADLIAAAGPGGGPTVRILNGANGAEVRQFFGFESTFSGGVFVAAGDVNQDGFADVVVSPDVGGGPRVQVISGKDCTILANFFGIDDANFRGGCRVAVGDVNGDTIPDLAVAAGTGGGPRIAVFDGATLRPGVTPQRLFNDFFAFESGLWDGTYVAIGDANGDGRGDVVVGAGPGGSPRVVVFSGLTMPTLGPDASLIASFFTGSSDLRNGVPVAVRNVDGGAAAEIVVGTASGVAGVGIYKLIAGGVIQHGSFVPFDPGFTGGVFVG